MPNSGCGDFLLPPACGWTEKNMRAFLIAVVSFISACAGEVSTAALDQNGMTRDNCPLVANADQRDRDHDGIGDACDKE